MTSLLAERIAPTEISLRPAAPRDAELLRFWRSEPSVSQFQPLSDLPSAQLRADLASQRISDLYRGRGDKYQWVVQVGAQPVGWITLVVSNWEHSIAEVGYALSTPFQGRGVMVPALEILIRDLFENTPLERLEARCAIENHGSQRVLEKAGFHREGVLRRYFKLRGERVDNFLYARLRDE